MILRFSRPVLAALAAVALSASAAPAFAQFAPGATGAAAALPAPPAGKGLVVFYRKPMFSLIPFNWIVREGKTEICEMVAGTYCAAPAEPGTHTYEVHSEVKNDLTLEIDAGETYYVVGGIAMGMIVNHPTIAPTPKAEFDALSPRLKIKNPIVAAPAATTVAADAPAAPATATPAAAVSPAAAPAPALPQPAA